MTITAPQTEDAGKPYDQFILFGDSITQMSYNQENGFGLGAQLEDGRSTFSMNPCCSLTRPAYARKLDVINRGFS